MSGSKCLISDSQMDVSACFMWAVVRVEFGITIIIFEIVNNLAIYCRANDKE